MANVGPNDVNIVDVSTTDQDFKAGDPITVQVRAEIGSALFGTGGRYRVTLTLTDTTDPKLLDTQFVQQLYGEAAWPAAGTNVFTFTVPGPATAGREEHIVQPQARLVANVKAPFDTSHVVGDTLLLTP